MATVSLGDLRQSISDILDGADLAQLSAKKVRRQLEAEYDADFTERKKEIDGLLMKMIDEREKKQANKDEESESNQSESDSEDELPEPPKKKAKSKTPSKPAKVAAKKPAAKPAPITAEEVDSDEEELDDEALAKKLQEEESGRNMRHRSVKKVSVPKVKRKTERKNNGNSVYAKQCVLSPVLARVLGTDKMARKDVVKKMWEIIKARNLQDPKNKQFMICDEQLMPIFGLKRVRTFGMLKYLKSHMWDEADICT